MGSPVTLTASPADATTLINRNDAIVIDVRTEKEFKEGLRSSLWDCDMCSYNIEIENIKIENEMEMGFTIITFQLDENLS